MTFLTGPNSSGKSSVLKALLLLKSNYNSELQVLDFSGPKHNLGTFENTLNNQSSDDCLHIGLQAKLGSRRSVGYQLSSFYKQPVTTKRSVYTILRESDESTKTAITIDLMYRKNERSGKLKKLDLYVKDDPTPFITLEIGEAKADDNHALFVDGEKIARDKNLKSIFHDPLNPGSLPGLTQTSKWDC